MPALELDAGDVLVLRGDKAQSPVTGLSGGDIVYSFVACDRDAADALYASPLHDVSPIYYAVSSGDIDVTRILLAAGADCNFTSKHLPNEVRRLAANCLAANCPATAA